MEICDSFAQSVLLTESDTISGLFLISKRQFPFFDFRNEYMAIDGNKLWLPGNGEVASTAPIKKTKAFLEFSF